MIAVHPVLVPVFKALTSHFWPEAAPTELALAVVTGTDGARLSFPLGRCNEKTGTLAARDSAGSARLVFTMLVV